MNGSYSQENRTLFDVDWNATVGNSSNTHDDFTFVASIMTVRKCKYMLVGC